MIDGYKYSIQLFLSPADEAEICDVLDRLRSAGLVNSRFDVVLPYLGIFPGNPMALYMGIAQTEVLSAIHEELFRGMRTADVECWEYCRPGTWIPHCGILIDDDVSRVANGVDVVLQGLPRQCTLSSIGLCGFEQPYEFDLAIPTGSDS